MFSARSGPTILTHEKTLMAHDNKLSIKHKIRLPLSSKAKWKHMLTSVFGQPGLRFYKRISLFLSYSYLKLSPPVKSNDYSVRVFLLSN